MSTLACNSRSPWNTKYVRQEHKWHVGYSPRIQPRPVPVQARGLLGKAGSSFTPSPGCCCGSSCCAHGLDVDVALWLAVVSRSDAGPSLLLARGPAVRGCQVGCRASTSQHLLRGRSLLVWRLAGRWLRKWQRDLLTVLACACSALSWVRSHGSDCGVGAGPARTRTSAVPPCSQAREAAPASVGQGRRRVPCSFWTGSAQCTPCCTCRSWQPPVCTAGWQEGARRGELAQGCVARPRRRACAFQQRARGAAVVRSGPRLLLAVVCVCVCTEPA